jgi:hypothetical protein
MKYKTKLCEDNMSFQECELAILRHAVDETEEKVNSTAVRNPEIDQIISILEEFLVTKKLICYGGTAINNILPREAQFYNLDVEIPDYDFYSPEAMDHAVELADLYYAKGYKEVEAKAGVHYGTFKVFVNFTPIADITYLPEALFKSLQSEAISIAGILYSPPDFLRMNMYLELSRPRGDVSRWEKVLKRLTILNEHYPFHVNYDCQQVNFQRQMDDIPKDADESIQEKIYRTVRDTLVDQGVVFFGGYASSIYSRYMPVKQRRLVQKVPDFDVLSETPERVATIVRERLADVGVKNAQIERREPIGEIVPVHYEIRVGKDILAHVYEPIACHSYNQIDVEGRKVFIGTIDTLLTFYLAFKYVQLPYYYPERIMCMAKFLFDVQQENRLEQRGILKRFSSDCVGKQETLDDIRIKKSNKFKELANQRGTREYNLWFLKYSPGVPSRDTTRRAAAACPCATKKEGPGSGKVQSPSPSKAAAAPATTKKRRRRTAATTQRRALMKLFA